MSSNTFTSLPLIDPDVTVTTDADGFASFTRVVLVPAGARALTATATDPLGNTSEFSDALLLPG